MLNENNKISKSNHGEKSMKHPCVIQADIECLPEKINTCHNNPEKSSTTKVNKYKPSDFSLFTCTSFDAKDNKLDCYRVEDCMKKFCEDFKKSM